MAQHIVILSNNTDLQYRIASFLQDNSLHYIVNICTDKPQTALVEILSQEYDICLLSDDYLSLTDKKFVAAISETLPLILISTEESQHSYMAHFADIISHHTLSTEVLHRSIRYIVEQKKYQRQLRALSSYDSLTQLPNRKRFKQHFNNIVEKHSRHRSSFHLLLLDIDHFKQINDTYGLETGDQVLMYTSKVLKRLVGNQSILARLGNDEFAILLESSPIHRIADTIIAEIAKGFSIQQSKLRIHISVGISCYPKDGTNTSDLMKTANKAMIKAKQHGGNRFCIYDQKERYQIFQHSWMETGIDRAITNHELFLEYQPIVESTSLKCTKLEALCRWLHPKKGLISPGIFIPAIEKTHMIIDLGRWVLQQACNDIALLQHNGKTLKIAVNISMMQISQASFVNDLKHILTSTGANAENLELELTESALMVDPLQSISTLTKLRQLGITIAIDDFGTGHSSLSYLVNLPVDVLKIDRSFIFQFTRQNKRISVIKAIIALGRSLDLDIVAEGVESEHAANYLLSMGCDLLQGHHICPPLALKKLTESQLSKIEKHKGIADN